MPLSGSDLIWGIVTPAMVAGVLLLLLRVVVPAPWRDRFPAALAILGGWLTGYGVIELGPWSPTAHWHWLPYLGIAAALIGAVAAAPELTQPDRNLLYFVLCLAAAWFLVPTWSSLEEVRTTHLVWLTCYLTLVCWAVEQLVCSRCGPWSGWALGGSAFAAMVILLLSDSLRFAQIGGCLAAAWCGAAIVATVWRQRPWFTGSGAIWAIAMGGLLYIGQVNSFSGLPKVCYYLVPVAPLGMVFSLLPVPLSTRCKNVIAIALSAAIAGCAVVIGLVNSSSLDEY